jgi:pimeloyl-ACP methyl ester carboxylesterase
VATFADGTRTPVEVVAGAGHAIPRERPEAVARAVTQVTGDGA